MSSGVFKWFTRLQVGCFWLTRTLFVIEAHKIEKVNCILLRRWCYKGVRLETYGSVTPIFI